MSAAQPLEKSWLTCAEYCDLRGISHVTAWRERRDETGPAWFQRKPRGAILYRTRDVLRFMDRHTRRPLRAAR